MKKMIISKSGDNKYITEIHNENEMIYSDVTEEKGGSGKYFRPHDFLEAAYASCLNITTRMILDSMNIRYEKVTVKVDLNREKEDKTIFEYTIDIDGDINEHIKNIVMRKVRNCPVRKTLSKQIEFQCCNSIE